MGSRSTLRALCGWLALAAGVTALLALRSPADAQDFDLTEQETERASELYSVHCASCHGATGGGATDRAPTAPAIDGEMIAAQVALVLRTGRMPPARPSGEGQGAVTFSDRDRELLVAYAVQALGVRPELIEPPEAGDAALGREVFMTNCAACHGVTGAGGVAGGGAIVPSVAGKPRVVIAEAVRIGPFEMPRFADEQISRDELAGIMAYLDEVEHDRGTPLGLTELNPVYASGLAFLLVVAVLLGCAWIAGTPVRFLRQSDGEDEEGEG